MSEALTVIVGNDETIVADALHRTVAEFLGGLDASAVLTDVTVGDSDGEQSPLARAHEALTTPPFLVPRRVVVVRDGHRLAADDTEFLLRWASEPVPGISLIVTFLAAKGRAAFLKVAGRAVDVTVGSKPRDRQEFLAETFATHRVSVAGPALAAVAERLGDDVARADSLARVLSTIFGSAPLTFEQIEPYVGEAGDVPEWDLTEAVDQGQVATAITVARRMLESRGRAGIQIVNILQRHYLKMAQLEGSGATTGEEAAAIIGGHHFPAGKLIRAVRQLGPDRIEYAISLIARADADLKGGVSYGAKNDDDLDRTELTVVEVLVARLAKLTEAARRS